MGKCSKNKRLNYTTSGWKNEAAEVAKCKKELGAS